MDVLQDLWDHGGAETDVSKGQIGEKEVHGSVELEVRGDSLDDEKVSQDGDQVHGQEQFEEKWSSVLDPPSVSREEILKHLFGFWVPYC